MLKNTYLELYLKTYLELHLKTYLNLYLKNNLLFRTNLSLHTVGLEIKPEPTQFK